MEFTLLKLVLVFFNRELLYILINLFWVNLLTFDKMPPSSNHLAERSGITNILLLEKCGFVTLKTLEKKNPIRLIIGYLNICSVNFKFDQLRCLLQKGWYFAYYWDKVR